MNRDEKLSMVSRASRHFHTKGTATLISVRPCSEHLYFS